MKTPRQIAEDRITLADVYSKYAGEFANLVKVQADFYKANRDSYKSDTATQRAFERTDDGVKMEIIKWKLKAIDKQMSASNTMLRLLENESKNLY